MEMFIGINLANIKLAEAATATDCFNTCVRVCANACVRAFAMYVCALMFSCVSSGFLIHMFMCFMLCMKTQFKNVSKTYSPFKDEWLTRVHNQFTLPYSMT